MPGLVQTSTQQQAKHCCYTKGLCARPTHTANACTCDALYTYGVQVLTREVNGDSSIFNQGDHSNPPDFFVRVDKHQYEVSLLALKWPFTVPQVRPRISSRHIETLHLQQHIRSGAKTSDDGKKTSPCDNKYVDSEYCCLVWWV